MRSNPLLPQAWVIRYFILQFNNIMNKAKALPLMGNVSFDLDDYVTKKATGGLFLMLGQQ